MSKQTIQGKAVLFYLFTVCQSVFQPSAYANIFYVDQPLTVSQEDIIINTQSGKTQSITSKANRTASARATGSSVKQSVDNNNSLLLTDDASKSSVNIDLLANAIRAARQSQQNPNSANNSLQINPELSTMIADNDLESITDGRGLTRNQLSIGEALKQACRITESRVLLTRCTEITALSDLEQARVLNALIQDESAGTVAQNVAYWLYSIS